MKEIEDKVIQDESLGMKEFGNCRCTELEYWCKKVEARCQELESEIQKKTIEFETLEAKFEALDAEKLEMEKERKNLNRSKFTERFVDLTEEDDDSAAEVELMMEDAALKWEKQMAETEAVNWKEKFEQSVLTIRKLHKIGVLNDGEWKSDEDLKLGLVLAGINFPMGSITKEASSVMIPKEALTGKAFERLKSSDSPYNVTPEKDASGDRRITYFQTRVGCGDQVRKRLPFDRSPGIKIAPLTPVNAIPLSPNLINICDSDEEPGNANITILTETTFKQNGRNEKELGSVGNLKEVIPEESVEDKDLNFCEDNTPLFSAHKRKRVVSSDSESEDEDNIPIFKLMKKIHMGKQTLKQESSVGDENVPKRPLRRRLVSLRQSEDKDGDGSAKNPIVKDRLRGIPTNRDFQDDESENGSESESESLNGFIVDDDDDEEEEEEEDNDEDDDSDSQSEYDENMELDEIVSWLARKTDDRSWKWEYEADMLADFGKDIELCMRAVCVLYRFQTVDEKEQKSTHHHNQRGFSKIDAHRGTILGQFLTDGDPEGDLVKSVEDLHRFDEQAVELCRTLATRYSKQLFAIYKNKEDPFFLPS